MQPLPLVSVVIPTYNRKEYALAALQSALCQTYQNKEIILIDDASSDGSAKTLGPICNQYRNVIFVTNTSNLGFVSNLNKAIGMARGTYIARLDDDDTWFDVKKIAKQVAFLEGNHDYVLVGGGVIKVNKSGKEVVRYLLPQYDQDIRRVILADNVFAHSAVLFRKKAWVKAGGYQEQFGFFSDWALWLEFGKMGKLYNFPDFFIRYTDQEGNKGNSARDRQIRRKLLAKIALNKKYKNDYAGGNKALWLSFASYLYSFIPFRKELWPFIFQIRKLIFGLPPYQYFNDQDI